MTAHVGILDADMNGSPLLDHSFTETAFSLKLIPLRGYHMNSLMGFVVPVTETVVPSPGGCGLMSENTLSLSYKYVSEYVISTIPFRWQSGRLSLVNSLELDTPRSKGETIWV
jgi:hypothetical protein